LHVSSRRLPPLGELESAWVELQARSNASFFLSWRWIETWLRWLPATCSTELVEVHEDSRPIALAILVRSKQARARGLIRTRSLHLHASGIEQLDDLTIEYNGLLAERNRESESAAALLAFLLSGDASWDELFLDGIDPKFLPSAPPASVGRLVNREVPVHWVDLHAARHAKGGYLSLIGTNTRYQIRASTRHFEKQGPLQIHAAASAAQALAFLNGIKTLQTPRWNERGRQSSFEFQPFEQFHRALINQHFGAGCIQLLKVTVGERVLGYLYNFVHNGAVLHYQVGIDYQHFGGSHNPGMVANRLAIELNAQAGHQQYNFLAGNVLYKRRLATHSEQMVWSVLRRNRLRLRVEDYLKLALRRRQSKPV
jgi:CelD/BcsL family acetyltransferase involved in cellulose biosynthesis